MLWPVLCALFLRSISVCGSCLKGGAGESALPKRKPMGQSRWKAEREAGLRDRSMPTTSVSEGMEAGD